MAADGRNGIINHLRRAALLDEAAAPADGVLLEHYLARRDATAFEALVRRHGPMVLGVCRRVLRNEADAEDAFQATFLVLVRKAASIRPRGMVGNWLYGVAHKTALKARAMNHRRRTKEREAGTVPKRQAAEEVWQQVQVLLDGELTRLPDKYRTAIVLCDLEGKTIKEAARHLGCPQGTLATRLTRGRALLARRLSRHGLALSAGAVTAVLAGGTASAGVPAALLLATVKAAGLWATGPAAAVGAISSHVAALTQGVLKTMLLTKLKVVSSVLLVAALACYGIGSLTLPTRGAESGEAARKAEAAQAKAAGGADKNVKAAAQGGVPLLPEQDVKIEVRGILQHWQLAPHEGLVQDIPKQPWTISAKGVILPLDLSQSVLLLDLDKKRFHGKTFVVKGTLEGQAGGPPVLKVQDLQPLDR